MYKLYVRENVDSDTVLKESLRDYGITEYEICKNEYGKPYFEDIPNVFFNISNKDKYSVCVISDENIGVDIEKIKYNEKVANKCFFKEELEYINNSDNKDMAFTEIWTMKESALKLEGKGLYGITDFNVINTYYTFKFHEKKGYLICICTKK